MNFNRLVDQLRILPGHPIVNVWLLLVKAEKGKLHINYKLNINININTDSEILILSF